MTDHTAPPAHRAPTFDEAAFAAFLDSLRGGAHARERDRVLLYDEVARLRELGFGALRLPEEHGGGGARLETFFAHLIDLAAADSSLAHIYRGHIAFVEGLQLKAARDPHTVANWAPRVAAGQLVGNAQSERQATAEITTRIDRDGATTRLSGTKYYTTGSIYADWIYLSALDGDERVGVTVSTSRGGVLSVDDWDGFGQQLTGSGTTTFSDAPVAESDIERRDDTSAEYLAAVFQLSLLAVVAGIAQAALDDTLAFVRPRRRIFGYPGETLPRDNEIVQATVGHVSSAAHSARTLVLGQARELGLSLERHLAGAARDNEFRDAMIDVFRLQQTVLPLVLDATTELFEVGGASAVSRDAGLDRHWRNVRTIASHNPAKQRGRAIGLFELNGELPPWHAPDAAQQTATPQTARASA